MDPFSLRLDLLSGALEPHTTRTERRASDLRGAFADGAALDRLIAAGDPVVYEVLQYDVPEEEGQLICCTTVLNPGTVGDEYFMTKGHYHAVRGTGEVYLGLAGEGYLLLATEESLARQSVLAPGVLAYVPPGWAHRTVNTGDQPLVFFAVYPGHAGHDYAAVSDRGFGCRVLRTAEGAVLR
ncbi:MAG TPA: glucose-6-phosphate isomerase family protein [Acidimicrobiales bacterium]|nr:glucose-6-phosphate isomerase family protein [Acidimicrobiales bacterium]